MHRSELAGVPHEKLMSILARSDPEGLKELAETLLEGLGEVEVLINRSGLVMLPMRDTAKGTHFHLGEVLMSEAHVTSDGIDGYGMRRGRDLEASMAMAVVDLAVAKGHAHDLCTLFVSREAAALEARDRETLARIGATRVKMETF